MDFAHFTSQQWLLAVLAALLVGVAKSGFTGVGMLILVIMAHVMRGYERESTGVVLPLLVCGDLLAAHAFHRHVRWRMLFRMLPPAAVGIVIGYFWLGRLSNTGFKPLIGVLILLLCALHLARQRFPDRFQEVPHSTWFVWLLGIAAGVTTMLANVAGPIMTLFFLAVALPKLELVATGALFFLAVNLFKIPFSMNLGFITAPSLVFNATLLPFVALGLFGGKWLIHRIDQRLFEQVLLGLTTLTALNLIFA